MRVFFVIISWREITLLRCIVIQKNKLCEKLRWLHLIMDVGLVWWLMSEIGVIKRNDGDPVGEFYFLDWLIINCNANHSYNQSTRYVFLNITIFWIISMTQKISSNKIFILIFQTLSSYKQFILQFYIRWH